MVSYQKIRRSLSKTIIRYPFILIRHIGLYPGDVFLASYPRSGSNWVKFLLLESILGCSLDFPQSDAYMPYVGAHNNAIPLLENNGRLIKTHEVYHPVYRKAIYIVRDPRDVVVSEYRLRYSLRQYTESFDNFLDEFLTTGVSGLGSWGNHVNSWLSAQHSTILVIRFTDLRRNTTTMVTNMLKFIGVSATDEAIQRAIEDSTVENMKNKEDQIRRADHPEGFIWSHLPDQERFINQGEPQGWKTKLSSDQQCRIAYQFGPTMKELGYIT